MAARRRCVRSSAMRMPSEDAMNRIVLAPRSGVHQARRPLRVKLRRSGHVRSKAAYMQSADIVDRTADHEPMVRRSEPAASLSNRDKAKDPKRWRSSDAVGHTENHPKFASQRPAFPRLSGTCFRYTENSCL